MERCVARSSSESKHEVKAIPPARPPRTIFEPGPLHHLHRLHRLHREHRVQCYGARPGTSGVTGPSHDARLVQACRCGASAIVRAARNFGEHTGSRARNLPATPHSQQLAGMTPGRRIMARPTKLTESEIAHELSKLPGWKVEGGRLEREYKFVDFIAAFGFMSSAALVAQQMDHHPDWSNVWNTVRVALRTHDVDGITALDVKLATHME